MGGRGFDLGLWLFAVLVILEGRWLPGCGPWTLLIAEREEVSQDLASLSGQEHAPQGWLIIRNERSRLSIQACKPENRRTLTHDSKRKQPKPNLEFEPPKSTIQVTVSDLSLHVSARSLRGTLGLIRQCRPSCYADPRNTTQ